MSGVHCFVVGKRFLLDREGYAGSYAIPVITRSCDVGCRGSICAWCSATLSFLVWLLGLPGDLRPTIGIAWVAIQRYCLRSTDRDLDGSVGDGKPGNDVQHASADHHGIARGEEVPLRSITLPENACPNSAIYERSSASTRRGLRYGSESCG